VEPQDRARMTAEWVIHSRRVTRRRQDRSVNTKLNTYKVTAEHHGRETRHPSHVKENGGDSLVAGSQDRISVLLPTSMLLNRLCGNIPQNVVVVWLLLAHLSGAERGGHSL
jgi:hypothetical protein